MFFSLFFRFSIFCFGGKMSEWMYVALYKCAYRQQHLTLDNRDIYMYYCTRGLSAALKKNEGSISVLELMCKCVYGRCVHACLRVACACVRVSDCVCVYEK